MQSPKCFTCGERHWSSQGCKVKSPTISDKAITKKTGWFSATPNNKGPFIFVAPPSLPGVAPKGKVGRPKVYANATERQRAYRLRKKEGKVGE